MRILLLMLVGLTALLTTSSTAQEGTGDPEAGYEVAVEICSPCHAISPEQEMSPMPLAPSFEDVANTPGMTEMALYAWMTTSHPVMSDFIFEQPGMPDIILEPDDLTDVVAYILSLRDEQQSVR